MAKARNSMDDKPKRAAIWISLIYALVGAIWIFASDQVVERLFPDSRSISHFQTYKGLGYIIVTAVSLYLALRFLFRRSETERASRAAAEVALCESEQILQRAQTIARLGRWTADPQTGTITASPEGAAMVGWEPRAHPMEELFELIAPEDRARVQAAWEATLNGAIYDVEHRMLVRGKIQWVHVRAEPERDGNGKVVKVLGITRDITERMEAETALRKSEERYRNLTEQAADSFFVHDAAGNFVEVNRRACDGLGYSRDELLAMKFADIEQELDQVALEKVLIQLKPGQARTLMGTQRRKDGTEFPVEIRLGTFESDGQRLYHSLVRDITDRKRAADALEMFRTLVDRVNDAIEVIDPETGRFLDINEKACTDLGYAREELLSLNFTDVDAQTDQAKFRQNKEQLWNAGALLIESRHRRKDGTTFPVEVNMQWVWLDRDYIVAVVRDIGERRQNEAALRSSEERLRACIDNTPNVAVQWYDEAGRVLYWNAASEKIFGWTQAEAIGKTLDQLIQTPGEAAEFQSTLKRAGEKKRPIGPVEYTFRRRDGTLGVCLSTIFTIPGSDGGNHYVCMDVDLTERKRAEEALRASEHQYAGLVNNIDGIVWEAEVGSGQMAFVSSQAQRILGYPVEQWLNEVGFWENHLHPDDKAKAIAEAKSNAGQGDAYDFEYRMIAANGKAVWIHDVVALVSEPGKPKKRRGVMVDVTDRKNAEAELRKREEQFRLLIENASDLITVINHQGELRFQSPSVVRMLGYQPEEMLGRKVFEYLHPEDAPRIGPAIQRAAANPGLPVAIEYRFRHQDGTWRYLQSVGRSIPGETPEGFIIVNSRDITETRKLEEQFRQAQKMEAIGQLAGGVAHDLNNILTVVHMQLDLLKHGDPLTVGQKESVLDIEKASRRAADLTRQLLMFSRRQAALKADLDLNAVVTNITKMLQRILGEDIGMQISYAPQPLPVHADNGMLDQVLLNLAVNSRDAMPTGGRLVIETSVAEFDEFAASQRLFARAGRFACIAVSDTGKGIPPEILPRIYEPFFTTKDVGKGTGLGLATVFGIIQQHHGWISVYSEVDRGTTFRFYLPLQNETAAAVVDQPEAGNLQGGSETILLVEDEQSLRVLVRNVLTRLGYRVVEATTGLTAIAVWQEHQKEIRLLLTDLVMPDGMTGQALAAQLTAQDPELKVIYTSGYSREVAGLDFPLQDGVNFLSKPFQAAKLAQTVRNILDR
jgi:two-component system cell cycle sensor histidine kinase/response regulator CckA